MKFAILSDIHANSTALKQAIKILYQNNVDEVIILGDLLSYGCDVKKSLLLLGNLAKDYTVRFIKGNHDQIYFDLQNDIKLSYTKNLPEFIMESINWTLDELDSPLLEQFKWLASYKHENCLFAHANPLVYKNWMYLNTEEEYLIAAEKMIDDGLLQGVFGHTHRAGCVAIKHNKVITMDNSKVILNGSDSSLLHIFNPGTIGQPRKKGSTLAFMSFDACSDNIQYEIVSLNYDESQHIDSIEASSLSSATKAKLISYYRR